MYIILQVLMSRTFVCVLWVWVWWYNKCIEWKRETNVFRIEISLTSAFICDYKQSVLNNGIKSFQRKCTSSLPCFYIVNVIWLRNLQLLQKNPNCLYEKVWPLWRAHLKCFVNKNSVNAKFRKFSVTWCHTNAFVPLSNDDKIHFKLKMQRKNDKKNNLNWNLCMPGYLHNLRNL